MSKTKVDVLRQVKELLTSPKQTEEACQAGVQFIVSPLDDGELGRDKIVTSQGYMIGELIPTEVFRSYQPGSDAIKIFPGSEGGLDYSKVLRSSFPDIPMLPTGGVSEENVLEWFTAGAVVVSACRNLCSVNWVNESRFDRTIVTARHFALAVQNAKI